MAPKTWRWPGPLYRARVQTADTFGSMLRRLRISAGLTQERLAEKSGISATGVAALEAGRRTTPRLTTVRLLSDALDLGAEQRAELIAAAAPALMTAPPLSSDVDAGVLGRVGASITSPTEGSSASVSAFVGRLDERQTLRTAWARRTRVSLIFGEAGVGKTTLAEELFAVVGETGARCCGAARRRISSARMRRSWNPCAARSAGSTATSRQTCVASARSFRGSLSPETT